MKLISFTFSLLKIESAGITGTRCISLNLSLFTLKFLTIDAPEAISLSPYNFTISALIESPTGKILKVLR